MGVGREGGDVKGEVGSGRGVGGSKRVRVGFGWGGKGR